MRFYEFLVAVLFAIIVVGSIAQIEDGMTDRAHIKANIERRFDYEELQPLERLQEVETRRILGLRHWRLAHGMR
jgi:hypothetical protein